MDNFKSMMDKFYEGRLEDISYIGNDEQELINALKENVEITDFIPDLTEEQLKKFYDFMDAYREELNKEIAYYEQRCYKLGASEIVTFLAECLMMKKL